jgi:hypothetical protein
MSVERIVYLPEETRVSFELQGSFPVFRETYYSPQAGTVTLKGLINQSAHIELEDGSRYRTIAPRKARDHPTELSYPVVHLPDKTPVLFVRTPLKTPNDARPRLRFTTSLDDQQYVFRQISPSQRGFELWDSMGMQKLIERQVSPTKLVPDLVLLKPVPVLLVLLIPWLDSQTSIFIRA